MSDGQRIVTSLWFDDNAEEAVAFYADIFDDSRIVETMYRGEAGRGPAGSVLSIEFELAGQRFIAINGGPVFSFTPAVSLFVPCDTQAEIDRYWDRLLDGGGEPQQCGWLTDRYGLSWQIVPKALGEMLRSSDRARADRAMRAMLQMVKLDIAGLQRAWDS